MAEFRGAIRVVARLRPALPSDFEPTAHAGAAAGKTTVVAHSQQRVMACWALGHLRRLAGRDAATVATVLPVYAALLGWTGDAAGLESLLLPERAGTTTGSGLDGAAAAANPVAPAALCAGQTGDRCKDCLLLPGPCTLSDVGGAVVEGDSGWWPNRVLQSVLSTRMTDAVVAECFDRVFGPAAATADVFAELEPMVEAVFRGRNATVLAYGGSGSGKSFTMMGAPVAGTAGGRGAGCDTTGLMAAAIQHAFAVRSRGGDAPSVITVSVVEVYCDAAFDLLAPSAGSHATRKPLPAVGDLSACLVECATAEAAWATARRALSNRVVAATAMNAESSRGHAIVRLHVGGQRVLGGAGAAKPGGMLTFVDLAGNENTSESKATGQALKEACAVNTSLSALADCLHVLLRAQTAALAPPRIVSTSHTPPHVPYRSSVLTRLLEDALKPPARVLFMCAISTLPFHRDRTLHTVRFACKLAGAPWRAATRADVHAATSDSTHQAPGGDSRVVDVSLRLAAAPTTMIAPPPQAGGKVASGAAPPRLGTDSSSFAGSAHTSWSEASAPSRLLR